MPSINTNIAALIAHQGLLRANADLTLRLERISTGLRINRASDDPVGLVKADRLSMELAGLHAAVDAAERGSLLVGAIDGHLSSIADHLETLKMLVAEEGDAEGLPPGERQLAIDAELRAIETIANTAVYGGHRLLDGSLAYRLNQYNPVRIPRLDIHQADLAPGVITMSMVVNTAAERGVLYAPYGTGSFSALGILTEDVTLEITGPLGVQTVSFAAGASAVQMAEAISELQDQTGVTAEIGGSPLGVQTLTFSTIDYGSDQVVQVQPVVGTGAVWTTVATLGGGAVTSDEGVDVGGWVNGIPWVSRGLHVYFSAAMVSFSAVLGLSFGGVVSQATETVIVREGGVTFQTGPGTSSNDRVFFGVRAMIPSQLGYTLSAERKEPLVLSKLATGQELAVDSGADPTDAIRVVEMAIAEVSHARSRLGGIDRTRLSGAIENLQSAIEAATAGEVAIRDADVAEETAALVRAQILSQASISMLGIANQHAEALLRLLDR